MPAPSLVSQTTYAELLERTANAAFQEAFAEDGAFTSKTVKQRKYWYFQTGTGAERSQRYVGPETPELLEKIERHKEIREDERERRALVSTVVRSLGLPRPVTEIGEIIAAFARAGVFRLRGVLVGTIARPTPRCLASACRLPARLPWTSPNSPTSPSQSATAPLPCWTSSNRSTRAFAPYPMSSMVVGRQAIRPLAVYGLIFSHLMITRKRDVQKSCLLFKQMPNHCISSIS